MSRNATIFVHMRDYQVQNGNYEISLFVHSCAKTKIKLLIMHFIASWLYSLLDQENTVMPCNSLPISTLPRS